MRFVLVLRPGPKKKPTWLKTLKGSNHVGLLVNKLPGSAPGCPLSSHPTTANLSYSSKWQMQVSFCFAHAIMEAP
jgi:hypothetical protein